MNIALAIVQFLVNEILSVPAFLIGIITAVGLAAMRKSVGQIAGAAIKATLGFLLIEAGAGLVVNSLGPLGKMIEGALGAQASYPPMRRSLASPNNNLDPRSHGSCSRGFSSRWYWPASPHFTTCSSPGITCCSWRPSSPSSWHRHRCPLPSSSGLAHCCWGCLW
ncbi:integral membrane protein [Cutibacterium acnes JCM 18909]|nr:integral membrane protein [Cutibacterium acnes JCM 18909]